MLGRMMGRVGIFDKINWIIPHGSPLVTIYVCSPLYVPTRVTSRHHWIIVSRVMIALIPSSMLSYWWNHSMTVFLCTQYDGTIFCEGLIAKYWTTWLSSHNKMVWLFTTVTNYKSVSFGSVTRYFT
jgi:hypothetical protein